MPDRQFRCAFFARDYERSIAFYGDTLALPVVETWDRGVNDRGTLFTAGSGLIEVLALPTTAPDNSVWDHRAPQGVTVVIEDDPAAWYERAEARGAEIVEPLGTQPWGHHSVILRDPDGLTLYVYAEIA